MPDSPASKRFLTTPDGTRHALPEKGSVTLGSAPTAEGVIHLEGEGVEARHCVIGRTKGGGYALKDLGSHSGVRVNGERVTSARLKVGDRLELGELALHLGSEKHPVPEPKTLGRLGGFRIEAKLGLGGMGEVLLAVQESLDRRVALKLLKKRLADDADFVQRFQTEAKSAAALNHPHVVHVYDVGIVDGRHYLAMEYMEGGTLEDRVKKEGPLDAKEVHRIMGETAAGLAYAESRGIVHRDIKPENLMLDATGRVKIADLGLATSIEAEGDGSEPVLGTPHFMAPEQARGGKVDQRADLYALGATAFRLLTGKTPYQGATTRDILRAHFTQEIPHPAAEIPGVPAELDAIIVKLLAKEPSERFASASELSAALAAIDPDSQASKGASKLPLILVGLAAAAVGGFFLFGGKQQNSTEPVSDPPPALVSEAPEGPSVEPVPLPEIPEAESVAPEDDEQLLANLEKLARSAYAGLAPITDPAARKEALDELALAFPGTTTATEASLESAALAEALAQAAAADAASAQEEARLEGIITGVRARADKLDDGAPAMPAEVIAALVELASPGDAALAARFEELRREALRETFTEAIGHATIEVAAADGLAEAGDFDGYQARLEALTAYFDLEPLDELLAEPAPIASTPDEAAGDAPGESPVESPSAPLGPGIVPKDHEEPAADPPGAPVPDLGALDSSSPDSTPTRLTLEELNELGLANFLALGQEVNARIAARPTREASYLAELRREDRRTLAGAVYAGADGASGLTGDFGRFDFDAAAARLAALRPQLATPEFAAVVDELASALAACKLAKEALLSSAPAEDWRRDSVPLPKGGYAEAISIDVDGITVAGNEGPRTYGWEQYQGFPELIDGLFKNRLRRGYTPAELEGIACLARFAAIEAALSTADRVLKKSDRERFRQSDADSMHEAFDVVLEWDQLSGSPTASAATLRERRAVDLLARALLARVSGQDTLSAARFEELLNYHSKSLTVLLLSDGQGPSPQE